MRGPSLCFGSDSDHHTRSPVLGRPGLSGARVGTGETGALGSPGEAEPVGFGFVGVTVGFGVVGLTVGLVPPPVNEPVTASGVP